MFESNQRLVLCVDFDKRLGNKVGIEVHDPDWDTFLEKTARNIIYKEEQYNLLKSWRGKTFLSDPLSKVLTGLHQRNINCIYRRINHFKFTFDENRINTKSYLYYCF